MLSGYKILVAEDNSLNQKIVTYLLSKSGAEVVLVPDGEEAIKEIQANTFDLVLMDIQMPGIDGIQTTRYIRKELKNDTPIIALSASSYEDEYKACMEAGMNGCILKPIDVEKLSMMIANLNEEEKTKSGKAYT
ncbi:MAG: response regulator [Taibaiella sp.]|nr:response regulator [Taibaiella sp.]